MTEKVVAASLWRRLWPLYVLAFVLGLAWYLQLFDYLSLETLQAQQADLRAFVSDHFIVAITVFILIYALITIIMMPGALWVTISGGLLFGLLGGALLTIAGATLGASVLFFVARTSIGQTLHERAGPFMKRLEKGFADSPLSFMFAMRLMPVVPFAVANIAPALLGARYRDFFISTSLGIVPGVVAYTWVGVSVGSSLDPAATENLLDLVGNFLPAFAALGVASLIPVIYKKFFRRTASGF